MAAANKLPFQYLLRGQQLQYLEGDEESHAIDQRDRDLEDYLGRLPITPADAGAGGFTAADPYNALGVLARGSFTFGDGASLTPGAIACNPIAWTMQVGRRYRLVMMLRAVTNVANAYDYYILERDGVYYSDRHHQIVGSLSYGSMNATWLVDGDGLPHTWQIRFQGSTGSLGYGNPLSDWYLEDVGPNPSYVPSAVPAATAVPWSALTAINGWAPYGGGFQLPRYRRVGDIVYVEGLFNGSVNTNPAGIAQLPAGFRPVERHVFVVHSDTQAGRVDVDTNGFLSLQNAPSTTPSYVSVSGMHFSVTP